MLAELAPRRAAARCAGGGAGGGGGGGGGSPDALRRRRRPPPQPRVDREGGQGGEAAEAGAKGGEERVPSGRYECLASAAEFVARTYVSDGMVVGLGSGPVAKLVTEALSLRLRDSGDDLAALTAVAAGADAGAYAARVGLPMARELEAPALDVMFVEADSLQPDPLGFVKGRHVQGLKAGAWDVMGKEKELAAGAKLTVALVYDADVSPLRGSVPVEVAASEWEEVAEELDDLFIGDAEVWRRSVRGLTDPRGGSEPYVTPRGNYVLDLLFEERGGEGPGTLPCHNVDAIVRDIESVPGVVAHGLWTGRSVGVVAVAGEEGISICPLEEAEGGEESLKESYAGWGGGE